MGASPHTGAGMVLVADDEDMVRNLVRRILERAGFDVIDAADGHAAVEAYRTHQRRIKVVVLDVTMPGLSGTEALREIRGINAHVPAVIASGYDQTNTLRGLEGVAGVEFLQKPFRADTLLERLNHLLVGAGTQRQ